MSHVSFSELKMWNECPFKRKLAYGDRIKGFKGNLFTAFGTAIHTACEQVTQGISVMEDSFVCAYEKELSGLPEEIQEEIVQSDVEDFLQQGLDIIQEVPEGLESYFGEDYTIVATEEQLYEPIKEFVEKEFSFKGYIDMVIKTSDEKYHVIDWKTCSWGWDARRRSDPMNIYQLVFYKHYYAMKYDLDPNCIDVHFGLLKRTAKEGMKVELFKSTSGKIRTENALKLLNKALYNISKERHFKNRMSCHSKFGTCEFYRTEHCP